MNFTHPIRIYYQDTDAGGVVFHANYLHFMERARTEWLRELGFSNLGILREHKVVFVVREANVTYHRPAFLDDLLEVSVAVDSLGRSQMVIRQEVTRGEELIASGKIHLVCATAEPFKASGIPKEIREKLEN